MLRKFLDAQLALTEEGKPLHFLRPLVTAGDTFLFEAPVNTTKGPHIRDAIDIKRWMVLVVFALLPCLLWGIWNTGLQSFVYSSGNHVLMQEFMEASHSVSQYIAFVQKNGLAFQAIKEGLSIVLPLLVVTYAVGGFWEALFAIVRKHEITEGFLVSGILFVLIMPPTIPLWMAAVGVSLGIILGKEVFGGSGMNIVNPAMTCRAFLFFGYPGKMSGNIWVGSDPVKVRNSLLKMNEAQGLTSLDAYTQTTKLSQFNISHEIKKIHVDAIATNQMGGSVPTFDTIAKYFEKWKGITSSEAVLGSLTPEQLKSFVTAPLANGGLGLSQSAYEDAYRFSELQFGLGNNSDLGFFLGNKLGCIGETSTLAVLIGACFLLLVGVASWRTMLGVIIGAFGTASLFQLGSSFFGDAGGAFNPAPFGFPAYKHLILGGLAFGLVFMATDPVSSPGNHLAKIIYGLMIGIITIVIRVINPAYPEAVMLAVLIGNVFAPYFDYYCVHFLRPKRGLNVQRI
jgi:Na+-transporting NADH:ubiquinone oxidoreductase subunit B